MKKRLRLGLMPAEDARMLMVIHFWGLTFLFTKLGLKSLDPLSFAHLRVASAVLVLSSWPLSTPATTGRCA